MNCEADWLALSSAVHDCPQMVTFVVLSKPDPITVMVCPPETLP